jgi:hypothetical protein
MKGDMANLSNSLVVTSVRRDPVEDGARTSTMPDTVTAITPDHFPNIVVRTVTPLASILIRSLRAGIQSILATTGLGAAGLVINIELLKHIHIQEVAIIAGSTAAVCALQNILELLGKLDQKYPLFRGA